MQQLLSDPALTNALLYILTAAMGQMFYAVNQWARKEIDCVMDRFRHDPRSSVAAILGNITAIIGVVAALPLSEMPVSAVIITAFFQGISADSVLNKNARKVWTDEERATQGRVP